MSVKQSGGASLGMSPDKLLRSIGIAAAAAGGVRSAARELRNRWVEVLGTPGQGRVYERGSSSAHKASSPGQPPAVDSGALRESINVEESQGLSVRVGTGLRYGLALEYGVNVSGSEVAPHPSGNLVIQPRPHARPARRLADGDMKDAMIIELRKGSRILPVR